MTDSEFIYLIGVIVAFVAFAAVLAFVSYTQRPWSPDEDQRRKAR